MDLFFRPRKYFVYQRKAKTKYYLHSPFVYQFYLNVLEGDNEPSSIKDKYHLLLYRLVKYFHSQNILLTNNSEDMRSACLLANPNANIISASADLSSFEQSTSPDLVFFGNADTKASLLSDFRASLQHANENSIFIIEGIYRNKQMNEAWMEIMQHPRVRLTIDVFQLGICFFRKDKIAKEDFVLRY
jgi:hypothetical protein